MQRTRAELVKMQAHDDREIRLAKGAEIVEKILKLEEEKYAMTRK
jgi:hypothetical protein